MPVSGTTNVLALRSPTQTLARLFADEGASVNETHLSSKGMPPGLSSHCNREISGAQVMHTGDSRYATSSLPA